MILFEDWGLVDYLQALRKQEDYVEQVKSGQRENTIIFCTHHPIVTLGRGTMPGDIFNWTGPTAEVSRGGRATYHGPSQILIYPIISIKQSRKNAGPNDIGAFLRDFEKAIVKTLLDFNIPSEGKSYQINSIHQKGKEETGVWTNNKKVASLGIAVRHWVTYHGAAINFYKDLNAFQGMKPCGFESSIMTSVEEILGFLPSHQLFLEKLTQRLTEELF